MTNRARQIIAISIAVVIALIAFFPLRMAVAVADLGAKGITASAVEGSIWSGNIRDLQVGPLPIGDVEARVHFWPLLTGNTELALSREPDATSAGLDAVIAVRGDGFALSNGTAEVFAGAAFTPLPVTRLRLADANVTFADNRCQSASGQVDLDVEPSILGLTVKRGLSGRLSCRGGALFVPLKGQTGLENLDLSIRADGRYTANFVLRGMGGEMALPLAAMGFRSVGNDGYAMEVKGRF